MYDALFYNSGQVLNEMFLKYNLYYEKLNGNKGYY
jgi:hypothetical protein